MVDTYEEDTQKFSSIATPFDLHVNEKAGHFVQA